MTESTSDGEAGASDACDGISDTVSPSRREFLKFSAAAGATLLGGCVGDDDSQSDVDAADPAASFAKFDHMVVVMFENRSFDSLLGYCYQPGEPPRNQTFNGLVGKSYPNPVPAYINDGNADVVNRISPGTEADMQNPNPDPGEEYQHVNTSLYNTVNPITNQFLDAGAMLPPYNLPPAGAPATMNGFVWDYCNNFVALNKRNPTFEEYRVIMDSFSPEQLPVINGLAKGFAVYDAWFCSVPTQTLPNRSFFHASSSSGFVVNQGKGGYEKWPLANNAPTIFNRLSDAGLTWRVYYDETQIVPMTALIHGAMLEPYWRTSFYTMDEFYQDVANGTLPAYAFVEPRSLYNNNDYHPPAPLAPDVPIGGWSDVRAGDLLAHDIYTAIKASATKTGSNALNTLLLVTFDEHGNCFDHVVPPTATTPQNPQPEGELGFFFDRLGVRVPTIAISAFTQAGSIINRPIHHGAVVRTLCTKYGLAPLTNRDSGAPDLSDALTLDEPRSPSTWPAPIPRVVPPPPPGLEQRPLNNLEKTIVGLAIARFSPQPSATAVPATLGGAQSLLRSLVGDRFKHP
jgi:phospholipase C